MRGKRKGCEEGIGEGGNSDFHEEWTLSLGGPQHESGSIALQFLKISLKTRDTLTGLAENIHLLPLELYGAFCYTDKRALEFNSP